jgi:hypothetical protein
MWSGPVILSLTAARQSFGEIGVPNVSRRDKGLNIARVRSKAASNDTKFRGVTC